MTADLPKFFTVGTTARIGSSGKRQAEPERYTIAWDRDETAPCERGTVGCCVDHDDTNAQTGRVGDCQCW